MVLIILMEIMEQHLGVLFNNKCPTIAQKGFIHCGFGHDRDTSIGYVKCCTRIKDTIIEKYIYQGSVDDF